MIVNSHTHYRMWYLTDRSTPAGLSLCLGCGLLATSPSSYRNGMGRRGSAQSQGGAGTASILLLPYHLHHRAAAVCLCTQRHRNNVCSISHYFCALQWNWEFPGMSQKSVVINYEIINLYLQWWQQNQYALIGTATTWWILISFCENTSSLKMHSMAKNS